MSGYKFRLQKILDYKDTVEGLKKSEYSIAIQKLNDEEEILSEYLSRKSEVIEDLEGLNKKMSIGSLKMYNNYIIEISTMIENQKIIIEQETKNVEKAQVELLEAMKEKKGFEKLKEKDHKEYIVEEKKKEAKVIDEIVTFNTNTQ